MMGEAAMGRKTHEIVTSKVYIIHAYQQLGVSCSRFYYHMWIAGTKPAQLSHIKQERKMHVALPSVLDCQWSVSHQEHYYNS